MRKTVLFEVLDLLKQLNVVTCESEFSRDWLHRSECYLRTCRFKGVEPSVSSVAVCASKLQHYGNQMIRSDRHTQLGETFLSLSERCHEYINERAEHEWMPAQPEMGSALKKFLLRIFLRKYLQIHGGDAASPFIVVAYDHASDDVIIKH